MNIDVYVLCYNEIRIAPFAVQYWKRYANKVYIYDNGSTDGCIEYFSQFPDFIEVRHFDSDGLNDLIHLQVKDNWKLSRGIADFVVVSDFDEFIYSPDLINELEYMKSNEMTIVKARGYDMVAKEFPIYNENKLSHEIIKTGVPALAMCKCVIFDPNKIENINYTPGCHSCYPTGIVKFYDRDKIFLFHHKQLGLDYYKDLTTQRKNRLSTFNIDRLFGVHYLRKPEMVERDYNNDYNNTLDVTLLY